MTTSSPLRTIRFPVSVELQTVEEHSIENSVAHINFDCAYLVLLIILSIVCKLKKFPHEI